VAQSDLIRSFLKFKPAIQRFGWALTLLLFAGALYIRFTQNADALGRKLDEGLSGVAALGALWMFAQGAWALLVVRQQDRAPKGLQDHAAPPRGRFEDPDDAIRRMSGR
jgi:hypothetical protein